MAVKRLMDCTELADAPFRSLVEVDRYLDKMKDQLKDMDSMLRLYQGQFARAQRGGPMTAADLTFKMGDDPKSGSSPKIISDKIDKIVVPKLEVLKNNFTVVDQISEKIQELETIEATVAVQMKGMRGQPETLKAIKSMRAQAEAQMQRALDYLSDIGAKHAPTPFKDLLAAVSSKLHEDLQYEGVKTSLYCTEGSRDFTTTKIKHGDTTWNPNTKVSVKEKDGSAPVLTFTFYAELKNLTEENGDIYPKIYIVFTCELADIAAEKTKHSLEFYVTVMHDFQTPGKFHPGRRIHTPKEALFEIGNLLSLENISHAIGTLPHNLHVLDKKFLKEGAGENVYSIDIDPASFTFWFIKGTSKKNAETLRNSIYPQVKALLQGIRNAQVKMRPVEDSDGRLGVKYSLINLAKDGQLNVHDLDELRNSFKLRDDQVRDIVRVINKTR